MPSRLLSSSLEFHHWGDSQTLPEGCKIYYILLATTCQSPIFTLSQRRIPMNIPSLRVWTIVLLLLSLGVAAASPSPPRRRSRPTRWTNW